MTGIFLADEGREADVDDFGVELDDLVAPGNMLVQEFADTIVSYYIKGNYMDCEYHQ